MRFSQLSRLVYDQPYNYNPNYPKGELYHDYYKL